MTLKPAVVGPIPETTLHTARAAFPKGSVVMKLRDEFGSLYHDENFRHLFPTRGQPSLPPWRLALVTVLQYLEHLSDRQAADAVRGRIDWKYALGLELDDPGFHFSVLSEFRLRLIVGNAEALLLDTMLTHFQERGLVKSGGKQRTDSTHVLAAVHDLSLLELVGETLRAVLNDLATVVPAWLCTVTQPEWLGRYGRRIEEYRLPRAKAAREAYAAQVGQDGFLLLDALESDPELVEVRARPLVSIFRTTWAQHFERLEGGCRWRPGSELPPVGERLCSPYDPEAHYSDKRRTQWVGYKVHLTETCDDDAVHLIVNTHSGPAEVPDVASTGDIHEALAKKNLLPTEHVVDAGYMDAELVVSSAAKHNVTLIGPARINGSWQSKANQGYDQSHFLIDWEHQFATCPQGHRSTKWRPGKDAFNSDIIALQFSRTDCSPCPVRSLCTRSASTPRHLGLKPRDQYEALQQGRAQHSSPEWRERYDVRAGIEGTLSQGIRGYGLRQTRYIGLAKTGLQHVGTAAAINILRVVNWLDGKQRETTRTSRFATLCRSA
jgi:transposase